jgi:hypothetical protein
MKFLFFDKYSLSHIQWAPEWNWCRYCETYGDVRITHDSLLVQSPLSFIYNNHNYKLSEPLFCCMIVKFL